MTRTARRVREEMLSSEPVSIKSHAEEELEFRSGTVSQEVSFTPWRIKLDIIMCRDKND
jgi:hypothetical protein